VQFFDHKFSPKNSLLTSILNEFLKNFAPFSEQRCYFLLNAFTKIVYAAMRERYGLSSNKGKMKVASAKGKGGKKRGKKAFSDTDPDSEFEASF